MKSIIRFAAIAAFILALPAAAQNMDWNMVGSAGTVDEAAAAAAIYAFTGTNAHFAGANVGQIFLRYPVTNTYGSSVATAVPWTTLEMAATDNSMNGFVRARLIQVDRCSNVETIIATVQTVDGPAAPVCFLQAVPAMDFGLFIYYIEVTIARNNANALEVLHSLALY